MSDLQLNAEDEVLLESLVLAASDNVARAPASNRDQFAPERRRVFVETNGDENVYLGTGEAWLDVTDATGLASHLFQGGDLDADAFSAAEATIDGSRVYVQDTEPTDAAESDVWIDTSPQS